MAVNEGLAQVIHKPVFNKFKKQNLCQVLRQYLSWKFGLNFAQVSPLKHEKDKRVFYSFVEIVNESKNLWLINESNFIINLYKSS